MTSRPYRPSTRAAGFTLIEVLIALFVLVLVLVTMLALFDASNKMARAQIHVADLQQSLRIGHNEIVRMTRMASRGWVINRTGWRVTDQVRVTNNATAAAFIDAPANTPDLKILPGTDVLRVRGVIAGALFEPSNPSGVFLEPKLKIETTSPSGVKQDLDEIQRARDDGNAFRILLVSAMGEVGSAEATVQNLSTTEATIVYDPTTSTEGWVSQGHPISVTGIIEEYAFYIRENSGRPRLSLARFRPGTNQPYGAVASNLRQDIADDFLDLQVAMAIDKYTDTNADTVINEQDHGNKVIAADEWFYITGSPAPPVLGTQGDLVFLRINTLARTQGRELNYVAPVTGIPTTIEDHMPSPADLAARSQRRLRLLQTVVDLRNM